MDIVIDLSKNAVVALIIIAIAVVVIVDKITDSKRK